MGTLFNREPSNEFSKNESLFSNAFKRIKSQKSINEKSQKSINEIKKLNKTLSKIEANCSNKIAEKYLNGYLENKGANSFEDFLNSLT